METAPPHLAPETAAGDVHIWQVDLADAGWDIFATVLAADENDKADRFRTRKLQDHYRRCRTSLRLLLARFSGQHPAHVTLQYGQYGKPEMSGPWQFNVSHSGDKALIAISPHPVGIDLEFIDRSTLDIPALAEIVCHPSEKSTLALLHGEEQLRLFYRLWTQKEAYCKACGTGLNNSLDRLWLNTLPAVSVAQVFDEQCDDTSVFFVHDLPLLPGYMASVCLPLADAKLCLSTARPDIFAAQLAA